MQHIDNNDKMDGAKSTSDDEQKMPHISVNAQYVKDLSFESPGVPDTLSHLDKSPKIDLSLDLNIKKIEENYYEVEIVFNAKASNKQKTLFVVDLSYAGVFHLLNIPQDQIQMILAVHCPGIIFPYARKIISDVTQDGGFQPLMVDPVDFGALYHKKMSQDIDAES